MRAIFYILFAASLFALGSCGSMEPVVVVHGFSFDARSDSPEIEILDFQYGNSKNPAAKAVPFADGTVPQRIGTGGPMLIGEFLYVKWKIRSSGAVFERKVDLKGKLAENVEGSDVFFVVHENHLTIYLVTYKRRPPDVAPNGPLRYRPFIVKTVYAD